MSSCEATFDGSGVALTCGVPGTRIGCLNTPLLHIVAATDAMVSGDMLIWYCPKASRAKSPTPLAGGTCRSPAVP